MSFGSVLQHSLNPSVTLLNWVKVYNAVCTPTPIHRLCTQTFSPPQKTNALLAIEPAAPPPSRSPSRDVSPLHQSTTAHKKGSKSCSRYYPPTQHLPRNGGDANQSNESYTRDLLRACNIRYGSHLIGWYRRYSIFHGKLTPIFSCQRVPE